jgi:hypothetical protein
MTGEYAQHVQSDGNRRAHRLTASHRAPRTMRRVGRSQPTLHGSDEKSVSGQPESALNQCPLHLPRNIHRHLSAPRTGLVAMPKMAGLANLEGNALALGIGDGCFAAWEAQPHMQEWLRSAYPSHERVDRWPPARLELKDPLRRAAAARAHHRWRRTVNDGAGIAREARRAGSRARLAPIFGLGGPREGDHFRPGSQSVLQLHLALPARQPLLIGIRFTWLCASGRLARVIVRTPFLNTALTFSGSTSGPSWSERWNCPCHRSL